MIRGVRTTEKQGKEIAIHYIGWAVKFDQWIDCVHAEVHYNANSTIIKPTVAKRGTNTIGPHRSQNRSRLITQYQKQLKQLLAIGFNDSNLNIQALTRAHGDVEQSKGIIASTPPHMYICTYNKNGAFEAVRPHARQQPQYNNNNNRHWRKKRDRRHRHRHGMSFFFVGSFKVQLSAYDRLQLVA